MVFSFFIIELIQPSLILHRKGKNPSKIYTGRANGICRRNPSLWPNNGGRAYGSPSVGRRTDPLPQICPLPASLHRAAGGVFAPVQRAGLSQHRGFGLSVAGRCERVLAAGAFMTKHG